MKSKGRTINKIRSERLVDASGETVATVVDGFILKRATARKAAKRKMSRAERRAAKEELRTVYGA